MSNEQENPTHLRIAALNAIGIWVLILVFGSWVLFRGEGNLTNETLAKLTASVDKFSEASENMNKVAIAQRESMNALFKLADNAARERDQNYGELYEKYGIDSKGNNINIDELYDFQLQLQSNSERGVNLHRDEDTASENGVVQRTPNIDKSGANSFAGKPKS